MQIIVDAGNGSGGFFAKEVLEVLGADTTGSAFLNPDGNFPNHIPNPEDQTAINFLKKAVTENNADIGIIFDTDVDRAACVDKAGNEINRNRLIALTSAIVLDEFPGSTIVTDSVTSDELHEFINFLMKAEIAAKNSDYIKFSSPNAAAVPLLPEEDSQNDDLYPQGDIMTLGEVFLDLGEFTVEYDRAWTEIKAS